MVLVCFLFFFKSPSVKKFIWRMLEDVPVRWLRTPVERWRHRGRSGKCYRWLPLALLGPAQPEQPALGPLREDSLMPWGTWVLLQHLNTAPGIAYPKEATTPA